MSRFLPLIVMLAATAAPAAYIEHWEGTAASNHNWRSWGQGAGWTNSVNMIHHQFGGIGNSDYVRSVELSTLNQWLGDYWPAYTEDTNPTNRLREASQDLHLNVDSLVRVYCRTLSNTDTLYGGKVYFFVGEWLTTGDTAFYYHSVPVTVNTNNWQVRSLLDLSQGSWVTITNINGRPVDQVYTNPQQCGFVIVGATSQPAGQFGFDDFYSIATNLALTNLTVVATNLYVATNSITAGTNFNVLTGSDVQFIGGREVRLMPGFRAATGSLFRAGIRTDL